MNVEPKRVVESQMDRQNREERARQLAEVRPVHLPRCHVCRVEMLDAGKRDRLCQTCADGETDRRRLQLRQALADMTPPHYRWATQNAPELVQRVTPSNAIARAFAAIAATSVVFVGPAGTGKTCLGRAVWVEAVVGGVHPTRRTSSVGEPIYAGGNGLFVTTFELAKARREHKLGNGEAELIEDAILVRALLLDELGSEAGRGDTTVSEIIHERHARDLQTFYTTPYSLEDLQARYGAGIARRIFESAAVIRLGGK